MDQDEPFFTTLGLPGALPPLPDDVWERALAIALDPTTPAVDADLVPDMDDIPVVPDDGEIVLTDDVDEPPFDNDDADVPSLDDSENPNDASPDSVHHDSDDLDLPVDHGGIDHHITSSDTVNLGVDDGDVDTSDGLDFGGDLY